ncbi:barwin-like endoglucanase [Rhizopogon vinicolor AM-OR11-026]|uniref:Barwin-like endoglucanase n=1 Tax=Rhizopogon vinicolor AM-OR11-026 TaxID=1314800 RepID=A0A1B7NAP1_9AGAM|nr:barwin-like endoglucanase [Rhizopogon vinicolor AM-OR11-026]
MISTFATLFVALIAVSARVVPRATAPAGWDTADLEPYDTYHCRYLALQCQNQHGSSFFDQCCHPLSATASVDSLPAQCQMPAGVTCSNGEPVSTGGSDDGDCDDEPSSTPTASTPTPTTSSPATPTPEPATPTPEPATTSAPVNVAPSPTTPKTSSTSQQATPTASSDSGLNLGGFATFFYQDGNAGACGTVHSDNDYICAIDQARYGDSGNASPLCGQQVKITNTDNGNTVTVTVADDCPTCDNSNSIDLSVAAFEALGSLSEGLLPIQWQFVN